MSRSCTTCQHLRRPDIDRRLAAGEPVAQIARAYELNLSSLHRHRVNCLNLGPSNEIKKQAARGSAAVELLPGKEVVAGHYLELCQRIDQIVAQAEQQGSLSVALSGLNSVKRTLDSLVRLAGHDRPPAAGKADGANAGGGGTALDLAQIGERLIGAFDHEPEIKARIAQALVGWDDERQAAAATAAAITATATPTTAAPATTTAAAAAPIGFAARAATPAAVAAANAITAATAAANATAPAAILAATATVAATGTGATGATGATGGMS